MASPTNAPAILHQIPSGSRVAVIRLRSLGDCVLTTPALQLLKAHRPDLTIGVVVEARFAPVFEGHPDVSAILAPTNSAISAFRPALAINLHGGTRSMLLTLASRAKVRCGFAHHAYSFLYSAKIPTAQAILSVQRRVHTAEHLASAMFWLGVPQTEIPRARLVPSAQGAGFANYAVIHPFASQPGKTWPAEGFLKAAEHLRRGGLEPVFIAGPGDDAAPFTGFRVLRNRPLDELKTLMAGAQLFIGNDSGPAHIAAAFGVPVVALFGPSDPVTWAPWRTESQVLTSPESIGRISVEAVIAAAESLRVRA
jgi:ADP-heptose:LPS heptosyltransferase